MRKVLILAIAVMALCQGMIACDGRAAANDAKNGAMFGAPFGPLGQVVGALAFIVGGLGIRKVEKRRDARKTHRRIATHLKARGVDPTLMPPEP